MVGILFWNTYIPNGEKADMKRVSRIEDAIVDIVAEKNCHIIVLAEFDVITAGLCNKLSLKGRNFSERKDVSGNARVKILADNCFVNTLIRDSKYYVIHDFRFVDYHFLIGGVHFPSNLHAKPNDIQIVGRDFICKIKEAEIEVNHEKVLMVGDFNSNPFETVMTDFDYLNAIFDSSAVERARSRKSYGIKNQFFYNPMWNLLGDANYPKGSYYSDSGMSCKLFWHIFDQVIISADLIKAYRKDSLKILVGTGNRSFLNRNGKPDKRNYSDHLPIFFSFQEDLL